MFILNKDESFMDYSNRLTNQVAELYSKEIFNSPEIYKKVYVYFSVPRIILNKEQIELYKLYSEYLIYFPNF